MNLRAQLLDASKRASAVLDGSGAKQRVIEDGFARIDPFALAEAAEITVMVRPMEKLLGAFLFEAESPGILINPERPIGMVRLTCAHELGHFHLGHDPHADAHIDYGNSAAPEEQAANQFAYHLLMPKWLVILVMKRKGWGLASLENPSVTYQLSLRLGVSYSAMVWSLARLSLLTGPVATRLAAISPKSLKAAATPGGVQVLPDGDVWLLDPSDRDSVLEPRPMDRFVLELPSHASAGYMWTASDAAHAGFTVRPVVLDSANAPKPTAPVLVGAPASMAYVAEPTEAAMHSDHLLPWSIEERQPWDSSGDAINQVNLRTQFANLSEGLSPGSRRRLIEDASAQ